MTFAIAFSHTAEDRSFEILDSIRKVFAEKGFDGASMQDLARAAGMSVGNFYRYFPSKAAIVEAMCSLDLRGIERDFAEIMTSSDPLTALRERLLQRIGGDCHGDGQLWAEITAASIRKPEIAAASNRMEEAIVFNMATTFARVTGREVGEAVQRYHGQCELLVMLVKAATIRAGQRGPADANLARLIVQVIDQTLNEIYNDRSKG